MKQLFLVASFFLYGAVYAQIQNKPWLKQRKLLFKQDSVFVFKQDTILPLAHIKTLSLQLTFIGNNENGFDVHSASPDNMYVLKPDSTFVSNMPVRK